MAEAQIIAELQLQVLQLTQRLDTANKEIIFRSKERADVFEKLHDIGFTYREILNLFDQSYTTPFKTVV